VESQLLADNVLVKREAHLATSENAEPRDGAAKQEI
jgi:hypothetical protein